MPYTRQQAWDRLGQLEQEVTDASRDARRGGWSDQARLRRLMAEQDSLVQAWDFQGTRRDPMVPWTVRQGLPDTMPVDLLDATTWPTPPWTDSTDPTN